MPDSEELNEILKEIKNINAPKEEKPKKPEAPLSFAKQEEEAPKAAEPEFKPEIKEEPKKESLRALTIFLLLIQPIGIMPQR